MYLCNIYQKTQGIGIILYKDQVQLTVKCSSNLTLPRIEKP